MSSAATDFLLPDWRYLQDLGLVLYTLSLTSKTS